MSGLSSTSGSVDVSVACFCDGSDAPIHVLSVELEFSKIPLFRLIDHFPYIVDSLISWTR